MNSDTSPHHRLPFALYLVIATLLVIVPVMCCISYLDFIEVREEMTGNYVRMENNTEASIIGSLVLVDTGLKIFDVTLDDRMRTSFEAFIAEYERSDRNPAMMDLESLKNGFGGVMDLYVIDADCVIRNTTYEPDLGLDFRNYPQFCEQITAIRLGDEFVSDRVVKELKTGRVRKFAYMPTPDHAYLLELGLVSEEFNAYRNNLRFLRTVDDLKALNPTLESATIYDLIGETIGTDTQTISPEKRERIDTIFHQKAGYEVFDAQNAMRTRYLFIDLRDPAYPSDPSLVVELNYNTSLIDEKINTLIRSHILITAVAILLCIVLAFGAAVWITRPIRTIVMDVNRIAEGDLDHNIRVTGGSEFVRLEKSINSMILTLKETISKLRASEERITEYNERLEELVTTRTTELHESNGTANLYLDIMSHDINNAYTASLGYAEMLRELCDPSLRTYANKMITSIHHGINIIENVSTMRTLEEHETVLKPVNLHSVIQREIDTFPDTTIQYAGNPVWVMADKLLPVVISNLIDNGHKFAGQNGMVRITVEEADDEFVLISVEDTGKGIPDAMKTEIFNRFATGTLPGAGKGLGLYITGTLIGRYGGTIRADDRIPGEPDAGAAIRFTLKKAHR